MKPTNLYHRRGFVRKVNSVFMGRSHMVISAKMETTRTKTASPRKLTLPTSTGAPAATEAQGTARGTPSEVEPEVPLELEELLDLLSRRADARPEEEGRIQTKSQGCNCSVRRRVGGLDE